MTGEAPCICGFYATGIQLTGLTWEADDGGTYYECEPGQFCISCDEIWTGLYEPTSESLVMPISVEQEGESWP